MPEGQSLRKPENLSELPRLTSRVDTESTFIPLLQFLLVKVGFFLKLNQLVLGELGLP